MAGTDFIGGVVIASKSAPPVSNEWYVHTLLLVIRASKSSLARSSMSG